MTKTVRPYHLTPSEETIMQILWESKEPLTQQQIVDTAESKGILCWKARSVFSLLNSLIGKKLIEEVGMVRAGKTYARTFSSTITRPEFYAKMVHDSMSEKELAEFKRVLKALMKNAESVK